MVILVKFHEFLKITTKMSFLNIISFDFFKKDYLKCMTKKARPKYHQFFLYFIGFLLLLQFKSTYIYYQIVL